MADGLPGALRGVLRSRGESSRLRQENCGPGRAGGKKGASDSAQATPDRSSAGGGLRPPKEEHGRARPAMARRGGSNAGKKRISNSGQVTTDNGQLTMDS